MSSLRVFSAAPARVSGFQVAVAEDAAAETARPRLTGLVATARGIELELVGTGSMAVGVGLIKAHRLRSFLGKVLQDSVDPA